MSWRHYAACQGRDPEMFFPSGDNDLARRRLQEAKAVCAGCAVRSLCLMVSPGGVRARRVGRVE